MVQERYKQNMDFVAQTVAYNEYIVDSVRRFLGYRVLDVGCGIGNTTALLNRPFVVGMDVDDYYLGEFRKRLPEIIAINGDISDRSEVGHLKKYRFDSIFCSNVLEHIQDDASALVNMHAILEEAGVLALIVPHRQSLYGSIDEANLHFRRYEKASLREELRRAGFSLEKEFCINFPGIFWWYLNGKILKRRTHEDSDARLINKAIPLVRVIDRLVVNSTGLTLVAIARK